jgi:hypothetical protein
MNKLLKATLVASSVALSSMTVAQDVIGYITKSATNSGWQMIKHLKWV